MMRPSILRCALSVVVAAVLYVGHGQTSAELLDHMRENQVGLLAAARSLGTDMPGAARAFGYEGYAGFAGANRDASFVFARCVAFLVVPTGTAESLGLSSETLDDYVQLRIANDLSFMPSCDGTEPGGQLFVHITVWTVGSDYPVAYHVGVESSLIGVPETASDEPYSTAYLGYARASQAQVEVEAILRDEVRSIALKLAAVR